MEMVDELHIPTHGGSRVALTLAISVQLSSRKLESYGVDGALCVLVSGPFANLSEGFNHVVDLIAHEKAAAWLEKRKMNPCAARTLFRQGLVQRLGLLVMRGWSQLIIAVTNRPTSTKTPGAEANPEVDQIQ